jgi:hypothetical protein
MKKIVLMFMCFCLVSLLNAQLSFTSPAGGEQWELGTTQDVIINNPTANTYEWCMIEAQWVGGSYYLAMINIVPGINTYLWTIDPGQYDIASNYTLRIVDGGFSQIGLSNQFEVVAGLPEITSVNNPVANAYWFNGNTYTITWGSLSVSAVNLYYSLDGTTNWQLIESNVSSSDGNSNYYYWDLEAITGNNPTAKIKVAQSTDLSNFATSSSFTLAETSLLSFTSPVGGELWEQGSNHLITFNNPTSNNYNDCMMSAFGTGGEDYINFSFNVVPGDNSVSWNINPSFFNVADDYKIKIVDNNTGSILALSNYFEIVAALPEITSISQPNSSDFWYNGNTYYILFESLSVSNVNIYYSTDGLSNWQTIASNITADNGVNFYYWTVNGIVGSNPNAKIKVESVANNTIYNTSQSFTLAENPLVTFITPAGGEQWELNSTHNIEIQNPSASTYSNCIIRIDGEDISDSYSIVPGINTISWTIPSYFAEVSDHKIIVKDENGNIIGKSNMFAIGDAPEISSIISPTFDDYWYNGGSYQIQWSSVSVSLVDIYFSLDGSTNWQTIATDIPSLNNFTNSYSWVVLGILGTNPNSKIKVVNSANASVFLLSNNFTLAENTALSFSSPVGAEVWSEGSTYAIQINNVSSNNFNNCSLVAMRPGFEIEIESNIIIMPGSNHFNWTINPNEFLTANDYSIILYNNMDEAIANSNQFEISGNVAISEVLLPESSSYWVNSNDYFIYWTSDNVPFVNLSYSLDGATDWQTIATSVESYDGAVNYYLWSLSGIVGVNPNSKIKVESSDNASVFNTSADFTLAESSPVTFVSPAGGEEWELGSTQTVEFNNSLSTNFDNCEIWAYWNGSSSEHIISSGFTLNAGTNTKSWTTNPSFYDVAEDYYLVIYDGSYNILCQSNQFKVVAAEPQITAVSMPTSSAFWFNGNDYYISWTSLSVDEVDILYSLNGTTDWQTIATNVESYDGSSNYYLWSLSGIVGVNPNSKIKVESSDNASVFNTSTDFTLAESSPVTFVSPAGGEEWELGSTQTVEFNNSLSTSFNNCEIWAYWNGAANENMIFSGFTLNIGTNTKTWTINPSFYGVAEDYFLVIYDGSYNILCQSNQFKVIAAQPQISLISNPSEGYYWFNGNDYYISWTSLSVDEVDISYSLDGTTDWQTIATNAESYDGSSNYYLWSLSGIVGVNPNSKIKIESSTNSLVFNTSADFTLAESSPIVFVSPAGGEEWEIGSEQTIQINNSSALQLNNCQMVAYWGTEDFEIITNSFDITQGNNVLNWEINPIIFDDNDGYILVVYDEFGNTLSHSNIFSVIDTDYIILSVDNLSIGSAANSSETFSIVSNVNWTVSCSESWLIANPENGSSNETITLVAQANTTGMPRNSTVIVTDGSIVETINVSQDFVSDIHNISTNNLRVYPNPSGGIIYFEIDSDEIESISIYDISGKMLDNISEFGSNSSIDISSFENGVYLLTINCKQKVYIERVVKQ